MASANDTFTDTDTTLLTAHTMDSGHTWSLHPTGTTSCSIQSNQMRSSSTGIMVCSITPASADYTIQMDLTATPTGTVSAALLARMDSTVATWYQMFYHTTDALWYIRRYSSGSYITLGSYSGLSPVGATRTIKLDVAGNQITGYVDGAIHLGPYTNSDISAAGSAGLKGGDLNTVYGDNWSFTEASTGGFLTRNYWWDSY